MRLNYDRTKAFIIAREGNEFHTSDQATSAGGIILATAKALHLDLDHDGDVDVDDLKLVTEQDIDRVFRDYFWDAIHADDLPGGIDLIAADIAWNAGPGKFRQFASEGYAITAETLTARRKVFYEAVVKAKPSKKKFLNGWFNRANLAYTESKRCEL
jgi:hypothetical protein